VRLRRILEFVLTFGSDLSICFSRYRFLQIKLAFHRRDESSERRKYENQPITRLTGKIVQIFLVIFFFSAAISFSLPILSCMFIGLMCIIYFMLNKCSFVVSCTSLWPCYKISAPATFFECRRSIRLRQGPLRLHRLSFVKFLTKVLSFLLFMCLLNCAA
jgi:hypothetical protein